MALGTVIRWACLRHKAMGNSVDDSKLKMLDEKILKDAIKAADDARAAAARAAAAARR